tara:strand:- start:469 stop:717 length:249 start_codon:yes stop_codon:yes gene_type:complete
MIKLHPETAQAIADLILDISVSKILQRSSAEERKWSNDTYWKAEEYRAIIKLTEGYGIPHNLYERAVYQMGEDIYKNATLED